MLSGLAVLVWGCASHRASLEKVTNALRADDPVAAYQVFVERGGKSTDLLFQLERAHLLHLNGRWVESNEAFQAAEDLAEALYSKSVSREVASLVTTDLALPYRGMPYELQLIHYYRGLNYLELGQPGEALVEARKANFELENYARSEGDDPSFRQDAFLHYFTGLLYAANGEWNDAIVSTRTAYQLYQKYADEYGVAPPRWVRRDYVRAARHVGLEEEVRPLVESEGDSDLRVGADPAENLVVFVESGFAPYRESVDITLPIFEEKRNADPWEMAGTYRDLYGPRIYDYAHDPRSLSHVLRFAFPRLVEVPPSIRSAELELPGGGVVSAEPALDLSRVAVAEFKDRLPAILLRTVARALAKEAARRGADRESKGLGAVVNLLGVASEQADTRGWLLLPGRVDLLKATLPPGKKQLVLRLFTGGGGAIEERTLDVDIPDRGVAFAAVRSFR